MTSVLDGGFVRKVEARPQTSVVDRHRRAATTERGRGIRPEGDPRGHRDRVLHAEDPDMPERVITASVAGTFFPAFADLSADEPAVVAIGDEIGTLVQGGEKHPVHSPFTGVLMGMLALPGERVRVHQPVAWLTTEDGV